MALAVAGRNEEKLRALSASLACAPPVLVASADDTHALENMAAQARVLVSAAGPFCDFGMPVVRAAVAAKTHYLDTTGEQAFVRQVAEELHEAAQKADVALSPSMGFDVVPGDVAAYLAACELGGKGKPAPCRRADVIYSVQAGALTRGTTRTVLGMMAGQGFTFRGGHFVNVTPGESSTTFVLPGETKKQKAILLPLAETVTVARALAVDNVDTFMVMQPAEALVSQHAGPLMRLLMDQPAIKNMVDKAIDHLPEGPSESGRAKFRWDILVRVQGRDGRRAAVLASGRDTYGMTGELLALYAALLAKPGFKKSGALSPSQLAPPAQTLSHLKDFPIRFQVV